MPTKKTNWRGIACKASMVLVVIGDIGAILYLPPVTRELGTALAWVGLAGLYIFFWRDQIPGMDDFSI